MLEPGHKTRCQVVRGIPFPLWNIIYFNRIFPHAPDLARLGENCIQKALQLPFIAGGGEALKNWDRAGHSGEGLGVQLALIAASMLPGL